jgi:hypothetical protein
MRRRVSDNGGMSNLGRNSGPRAMRPPTLPTPPSGTTIARYATYAEAQKAVDFLSDNSFPVRSVTIVGTDLRMVERVTGRLSYGRVALGGAASGAYFGLFVGLLLLFFAEGQQFSLLFAVVIGSGFGMLFGVMSYAFTGGRRDFTSASQIVASEYQVLCADEHARAAMDILGRLAAATGRRTPPASSTPAPPAADPFGPPPGTPPSSAAAHPGPPAPAPAARPTDTPADPPGPVAAVQPTAPEPVEGLTYGEVMEARRRERLERERVERERVEAERTAAERAEAERKPDGNRPG